MNAYDVRSSVERFRGRVVTVVSDEVVMPDGGTAVRDYLRHPGAAAVVALDASDRVVLVRQYRHPVRRDLWELPAGLLDVAGEPAALTAARELAEEADLVAADWHVLVDSLTTPGCSDEAIRLYLARSLSPVPEDERHVRFHEESTMTVHHVPLDDAVDMVLRGEIENQSCAVGVLAVAQARARGYAGLRAVDSPWPARLTAAPG